MNWLEEGEKVFCRNEKCVKANSKDCKFVYTRHGTEPVIDFEGNELEEEWEETGGNIYCYYCGQQAETEAEDD